jgi:hypothetical protein
MRRKGDPWRTRGSAIVAPPTAPIELPMPTMGKRRFPCSSVYVSAAKLQNCATVTVLKTPTHKKNGIPSGTPRTPRAQNTPRFIAKKSVTEAMRTMRPTRAESHP